MHSATKHALSVFAITALILVTPFSADAQTAATIVGDVTDPSGAAVPGVSITVTSEGTGAERTVSTNAAGQYRVTPLNPGAYSVRAASDGFTTQVRSGVVLQVSAVLDVSFQLVLGQVSETIEVTGATGTIGSTRLLAFTPATDIFWRADAFEMIGSTIYFDIAPAGPSASDQTFRNMLNPFLGESYSSNTPYVATYEFRAIGVTQTPTAVTPVAFIMSGTQIKYTSTDTSTYQSLPPIPPVSNRIRLDKEVSPESLPLSGGLSTWTITLENHGQFPVRLDELDDLLPAGLTADDYVTNSARFDGDPLEPVAINPSLLRWTGALRIPACWDLNRNGTCDLASEDTNNDGICSLLDCAGPATSTLTYVLTIPPGEATYENRAYGVIGVTRIDTTFDPSDDAPARAGVTVGSLCGDGLVEGAETCDDGNNNSGDGCSASCQIEPGYGCVGTPSVCTSICGDGIVASDESCDDGNDVSGDGCDATCNVESGFACTGSPSVCTVLCGDGLIRGSEACDDGNVQPGDGCSETCTIEPGF
jgi:cysteine-rich repeat protein